MIGSSQLRDFRIGEPYRLERRDAAVQFTRGIPGSVLIDHSATPGCTRMHVSPVSPGER